MHRLQNYLASAEEGTRGVCSVCSAHPWVIRAAAEQAVEDASTLLIEATSNQVNQFGGYTGMRPAEFRAFVEKIVTNAGLPLDRLILGGDHLGPNPWRNLTPAEAMRHAETMVSEYVAAGFTKIHLDASMACSGDPSALSDDVVAARAVRLAMAAEHARSQGEAPVYVIGTEVPTPGGATHSLDGLQVTLPAAAQRTLDVHRKAFSAEGLADVWDRVLAIVVQPGVEFDHDSVVEYDPEKARGLVAWRRDGHIPQVFEAHSTDYQLNEAYKALVKDSFSILKVGPALTFALREALYALADIEQQLVPSTKQSGLAIVVEDAMLNEPGSWQPYYHGDSAEQKRLRVYSYSDRVRYYWHKPSIIDAIDKLVSNLNRVGIPETMLSRYLPEQFMRVRARRIKNEPVSLIVDKVRDVLRVYAAACVDHAEAG